MQKRKNEEENNMNQNVCDDLKYQELLILAYFRTHYKKYVFNVIAQIMGMTYAEMRNSIEHLMERKYLVCIETSLVLSKKGEDLLKEQKLVSFFDKREKESCDKTCLSIDEAYIPIKFEMQYTVQRLYLLEKENQVDFQSGKVAYIYYQEKDRSQFLIVKLCSQENLLS